MQAHLLCSQFPTSELGEGPVWHQGKLWWVDILGKKVHWCVPTDERQQGTYCLEQMVGAIAPCQSGGWLAALQDGVYRHDDTFANGKMLAKPAGLTANHRFNDGKCDPKGHFWVGTTTFDNASQASCLYRIEANGNSSIQQREVTISNGLAWSAKGDRLYYIDTMSLQLVAFPLDAQGEIRGEPEILVAFDPKQGYPDGMSIDAQGNLWIAFWEGSSVRCYDSANGKCLVTIELPVPLVTSCCFGGTNLETLYITTAWTGMDNAARESKPLSGAVFACEPGVGGATVSLFQA
jgi:sugar lactone lactonase YvrE